MINNYYYYESYLLSKTIKIYKKLITIILSMLIESNPSI